MAITKKKTAAETKAADDFISGAPDAATIQPETKKPKPKYVKKGKKLQITLTIAQPLLERVDEMAERLGQSRAAVINFAIFQGLESGLQIDPSKEF